MSKLKVSERPDMPHAAKRSKTPFHIDLLADRLMVQLEERGEQKTSGGIIIPASLKDNPRPERGVVVAIGTGFKEKAMSVVCGDVVILSQYAGSKVKLNGINYTICRETDVWANIDANVSIEPGD